MRNKRILYLFCVLLLAVTLVVLSGVLFAVEGVEVNLLTPQLRFDLQARQEMEQALTASLGGTSILALSEKQLKAQLERDYPLAAVEDIERVFPSTILLHVRERYELYCIQHGQGYLHIDSLGKVLAQKPGRTASVIIEGSSSAAAVYENIEVLLPEGRFTGAEAGGFASFGSAAYAELLNQLLLQSGQNEIWLRQLITRVDLSMHGIARISTAAGAQFVLNSYDTDAKAFARALYTVYNLEKNNLHAMRTAVFNITLESGKFNYAY